MTVHQPRWYQAELIGSAMTFWQQGGRNCLLVAPTGSGKTFIFARIASLWQAPACAIAHRAELVGQMSVAFAREGVRHRVIGSPELGRMCTRFHLDKLGANYVDPNARVAVAGVDTLIRRDPAQDPWFAQVRLWIQDECHHVLRSNKWGRACEMFPNAYGLGVTATAGRADGKGLGRHADGVFDAIFIGPTARDLITEGFLTDYRIFAPRSDLDLTNVPLAASGDYSPAKLAQARKRSRVTGDVVKQYLRLTPGKLGITFDVDVESATATAKAFRDAGVPAEVVHGEMNEQARDAVLRRFEKRQVLELVNVDLFGEGFDLPALEVVSMARPTQSYALFAQQFGRALRIMPGKRSAYIIDHVENCLRHGLPDWPREWSLDRRSSRSTSNSDDAIPTRVCRNPECLSVYERYRLACPYCGEEPLPSGRATPEQVDGDLHELDPAALAALFAERARVDGMPAFPPTAGPAVVGAIKRTHWERQQAQQRLRDKMALWAGWQKHQGRPDREAQRRFYLGFGVDVATAQTLNAADADTLSARIENELQKWNVRAL